MHKYGDHIIIPADQVDRFRVETKPGHRLEPVELENGDFALPLRCIPDPAHKALRKRLNALPRRDVAPEERKGWSEAQIEQAAIDADIKAKIEARKEAKKTGAKK